MKNYWPKLYLSDDSLDEVKRSDRFEKVHQEIDSEGLWKIIEETHKVNTISKVQSVTKRSARATYQRMRQCEFYISLDIFEGLDNARRQQAYSRNMECKYFKYLPSVCFITRRKVQAKWGASPQSSECNPSLLQDVERAECVVKIDGVAGHQFTVEETGFLDPLFPIYANKQTQVNILSLSEVEDQYIYRRYHA